MPWLLQLSLQGDSSAVAQSRPPKADPSKAGWDKGRDFYGFDHQEHGAQEKTDHCVHTRWGDCANRWSEVEATYAVDYGAYMHDHIACV